MSDALPFSLLPYFLLFAAILAALFRANLAWVWSLAGLSLALAWPLGVVGPDGFGLAVIGAAIALAPTILPQGRVSLLAVFCLATLFAAASFLRLLPGFPSLLLLENFGRDSERVLSWRYDKGFSGLMLVWLHQRCVSVVGATGTTLPRQAIILAAGTGLVLALAAVAGLGDVAVALVTGWWLWILGNMFLTVVAEEALFRGVLQRGIERALLPIGDTWAYVLSLCLVAFFFGLAHLPWGISFSIVAGAAGLMYGVLYGRNHSLPWAVAGHSAVNSGVLIILHSPFG